jgi:hypothetical protein
VEHVTSPPPQPQPDPWLLRASDADREKILRVLREAYAEGRLDAAEYEERMSAALAAKTYADLLGLLDSLPVDPARLPSPPGAGRLPTTTADPRPASLVPYASGLPGVYNGGPDSPSAIFGSTARKGQWVLTAEPSAFALFGEVKLDLTSVVLSAMQTELRCNAVFGSIELVVPDSINVQIHGTPVLGDFSMKDKRKGADRQRVAPLDAPTITITGVALFGGVELKIVRAKPTGGVTLLQPPAVGGAGAPGAPGALGPGPAPDPAGQEDPGQPR